MPGLLASVAPLVFGAGGSFALVTAAGGLTIAGAVVSIGASLLLSAATNALFGPKQPKAQDIQRELSLPTALPSYRFVYGQARATGTPAGTPVRNEYIWGCWILNSRPSDLTGTVKLFLDKREVTFTGDAFDFDGTPGGGGTGGDYGGADADTDPFLNHVRFWIGRGDQTSPPRQFLEDAPWATGDDEELWLDTDAWEGRTVIWMRLDAGANDKRQERWPSAPPLVEVEGKWSKVYDPREATHDLDDPDTWEWSDNHALCVLDALTQNPVRGYTALTIHEESFKDGANICDQSVSLKAGGTEKRYRAAGTQTFGQGEIEDQINPLVLSGAADLIQIGGRRGYAAGAYRAPSITIDDFFSDSFEAPDLSPGNELVNELRVSYLSPERGYETAELKPYSIPGALSEDNGIPAVRSLELSFCPSPTQAMRVRKIISGRIRRQERLDGGSLPPEALDLVAGATVTIALDAPYDDFDGVYEIESIHPAFSPLGDDGGLAMRMPARLVKHDSAIYDWTPATDEEDVNNEPYGGARKSVSAPGSISTTTGDAVNLDTGGTVIPRILYEFDPSTSKAVTSYEWQEGSNSGDYGDNTGELDADVRNGSGKVFVYVQSAAGDSRKFRVRAVSPFGKSAWVEVTAVSAVVSITLDLPTIGTLSELSPAGTIEVPVTLPNDSDVKGIEVYAGPDSDVNNASALSGIVYASQNATVILEESGLGSGVTRYYFARSRGDFSSASAFTAGSSITTA